MELLVHFFFLLACNVRRYYFIRGFLLNRFAFATSFFTHTQRDSGGERERAPFCSYVGPFISTTCWRVVIFHIEYASCLQCFSLCVCNSLCKNREGRESHSCCYVHTLSLASRLAADDYTIWMGQNRAPKSNQTEKCIYIFVCCLRMNFFYWNLKSRRWSEKGAELKRAKASFFQSITVHVPFSSVPFGLAVSSFKAKL